MEHLSLEPDARAQALRDQLDEAVELLERVPDLLSSIDQMGRDALQGEEHWVELVIKCIAKHKENS